MRRRTKRGGSTGPPPRRSTGQDEVRSTFQVAAVAAPGAVDVALDPGGVAVAQLAVRSAPRPSEPAGSTCTVTSSGSVAISSTNRCRRAISNATSPTSHGRRGHGQRLLDPSDVEHEDPPRAQLHRPADRDAVHQSAVEVVLAVDPYRRQQARHGGRGEHGRDQRSTVEPVRAPARSTLAATHWNGTGSSSNRRTGRCCSSSRRSGRLECRWVPDRASVPSRPKIELRNTVRTTSERQTASSRLRRAGRVGGDEDAVDGADRGAQDEVGPDAGVGQRGQHAHLVRAEHPAAAEDERGRRLDPCAHAAHA